jgi:hypothetical protein
MIEAWDLTRYKTMTRRVKKPARRDFNDSKHGSTPKSYGLSSTGNHCQVMGWGTVTPVTERCSKEATLDWATNVFDPDCASKSSPEASQVIKSNNPSVSTSA